MHEPERGPSELRVALLLGSAVALLLVGFHRSSFSSSDEAGAYEITRSIATQQSLRVPEIRHSYLGRDGGRYSHFAIGQSLLVVPLYALGSAAAALLPEAAVRALAGPGSRLALIDRVYREPQVFAVLLYPPLATGVLVALFFGLELRLGASRASALRASLLLAGCSYVALMSTFFLGHTSEAVLVLGSLLALCRFRETGRYRFAVLGSLAASLLLLVRVPATVAGVGIVGYAVWTLLERQRGGPRPGEIARTAAALAVPFLVTLAVYAMLNQRLWGTWLDSPMVAQRSRFGAPSLRAALGLLVSPGAGLLAYSPLLVLAPWTLTTLWRRKRAEAAAILAICASLFGFILCFELWHGLWGGPGPRYLFVCVPLLCLPLGPWLDIASARARLAVALLAALGAAVQLSLMTTHWWSLVEAMGYPEFEPRWGFLFVPELSPIVGAARLRLAGLAGDSWWLQLASGWPGEPARPLAAGVLLAFWLAGLAYLTHSLQRVLADPCAGRSLSTRAGQSEGAA